MSRVQVFFVVFAVIFAIPKLGRAQDRVPLHFTVTPELLAALDEQVERPVDRPPDRPVREPHPMRVVISAFIVANATDSAITYHLLSQHRDRIYEANPMLRPLQDSPEVLVIAKSALMGAASYLLIREHRRHPWVTFWVGVGGAALYSWAAVQNWQLNP